MAAGSKYSDDQWREAAVLFAVKGTAAVVSRELSIPEATLSNWRRTEWWETIVDEVRRQNEELARARYAELVDKATAQALERLPEASAKDACTIAAISTDKLRVLQNLPTRITATTDSLEKLARQFEAISESYQERCVDSIQGEARVLKQTNQSRK